MPNPFFQSLLNLYRIDTVPVLLRPLHWLYAHSVALVMFVYSAFIHHTSRIEFSGQEHLQGRANHIFCMWHTFTPLYFCVFMKHIRYVWMEHPGWFMMHLHIFLHHFVGVEKIIFGSTGHFGREAADEIVEYLKQGYSTVLVPDGPYGPPYVLHKGILHMSQQSGVPVIAIQFSVASFFRLRGWDRKRIPLPFNSIKVRFSPPVQVTSGNLPETYAQIQKELGFPD
jgi:lysophospholipid acyltransferase (LPLAT)-like uncharacterized protein